jgi:2-polyprenyl-3-methyl-5-hydroxy-6-metoxy-1,4-benzoquinol methylase
LPRLPGETEVDLRRRRDEQYYRDQLVENHEWWARIGEHFNFGGSRVLDFGCGHGALSIGIAEAGAHKVLGIDLDAERVAYASSVLQERYPGIADRVRFEAKDVRTVDGPASFDYIVSKDTFEHVDDLASLVPYLKKLLKPGGKLIVGFSPLYYSPFGDHGRLRLPGVWLHAVIPERVLLKWASFRRGEDIRTIADIGLNKLTPDNFRRIVTVQGWCVCSIKYNRGRRMLMPALTVLRNVPLLEKYCTVNIYAVLKTPTV